MNKVFISVVSHGHSKLIKELGCLYKLSKVFNVVVKSNCPGDNFEYMNGEDDFHWINNNYFNGFGANNNCIFSYCKNELGMTDKDYFIVLNPDVIINNKCLSSLCTMMMEYNVKFSSINLFKDSRFNIFDPSIRKFPTIANFVKSFLGMNNASILDKAIISTPCEVDWAAGSFLAFFAGHYEELNGFDERYFMYCEDIDICYRSHKNGVNLTYFPNITAMHLAKHENRKIISKHFFWHLKSIFIYLISTRYNLNTKSVLKNAKQ